MSQSSTTTILLASLEKELFIYHPSAFQYFDSSTTPIFHYFQSLPLLLIFSACWCSQLPCYWFFTHELEYYSWVYSSWTSWFPIRVICVADPFFFIRFIAAIPPSFSSIISFPHCTPSAFSVSSQIFELSLWVTPTYSSQIKFIALI